MRTRPKPQDVKIHYPQQLFDASILTLQGANKKANDTKNVMKIQEENKNA